MNTNADSHLRCILCGGTDVRFAFSEWRHGQAFSSYQCPTCDVYMTLGEIPPVSPDYIGLDEEDLIEEHLYLQRNHKLPAFEQWTQAIRRVRGFNGVSEMGPLLDIGCGVGGFLDFAADNQLCRYGFDASDAQVRLAKERHPNVRTCTSIEKYIELIPHAPKFELVTMWDVLEHIRDPHTLLQNVRKHMAPTGLFFASVPSGAPLRTKLMLAKLRGREPGLVPWEHVFYYTKCSLRRLLAMNGFDVLAVDGVVAYIRTLSNHEIARRIAHRLLLHTPYALQIFVLAMPSR